ncbi:MAG: HNH endonuclease [Candidatus Thorarchaeota archaeon]|nr:MAG: HNH endonuclease [Candidatus Thorarchaeota archaeon]
MTTARKDEIVHAKGKPLILHIDVAGNPCRWINYEQAAFYYAKDLVAWSFGAEGMRIHGGINRQGLRSFLDLNTIIAVRGELGDKAMHRTPSLTNRALFRRDQHVCAYCGNEFGAAKLSRDHVTPRGKGGRDTWKNVVTACGSCNKHKDCRTPEEASMKLLYIPYAPNRSEYLILMNRTILADQMEFLKARVTKDSRILQPFKPQ